MKTKFVVGDQVRVCGCNSDIGIVTDFNGSAVIVRFPSGTHCMRRDTIEKVSLEMAKEEPAIRAAKKAYRSTKVFQLDQLLELESKWKRKVTIASNKLADVREQITKLAKEMAQDSVKPQGKTLCEVFADEAKSKEVRDEHST